MPSLKEIVEWVFHVPSEYELLWWVLVAVMWYGFTTERKLRALQLRIEELAGAQSPAISQAAPVNGS